MTHRGPGRKSALIGLGAMAFLVLGMLSPAAYAQVPGVDVPVVDVPLPGGDGGSDGGGSGGNDPVGSVIDTVVDTTDRTTDPVGNTVEETGEGLGSKPVQDAGKTIGETTKGTGGTVGETVNNVTNTVGGVGGIGGVIDPDLVVGDPRQPKKKSDPEGSTGAGSATERPGDRVKADRLATGLADGTRDLKAASLRAVEDKGRRQISAASVVEAAPVPASETFITQLADAAVDATKKLAFPLGLALMVGAFLMVQGRIDRKDAKLALAPINSEQDLLSFQ